MVHFLHFNVYIGEDELHTHIHLVVISYQLFIYGTTGPPGQSEIRHEIGS